MPQVFSGLLLPQGQLSHSTGAFGTYMEGSHPFDAELAHSLQMAYMTRVARHPSSLVKHRGFSPERHDFNKALSEK